MTLFHAKAVANTLPTGYDSFTVHHDSLWTFDFRYINIDGPWERTIFNSKEEYDAAQVEITVHSTEEDV